MEESELKTVSESGSPNNRLSIWSPVVTAFTVTFTLVYFADIFIRSSKKLYWYDELFTEYLCQMPTFKDTWTAVMHGADFNPPLFYLLTRVSQALFGHGPIATRLPETLGVWILCISLFIFVSRRVGVVAGSVAGLFPFFTLAQYYAYEARPHGLAAGWCGVALLCWQNSNAGRMKLLWSCALTVSLVAAALSHVFAIYLLIPFGLVELYSLYKTRTPNWANVCAVCLTPFIISPVFLPLLKSYRALFGTIGGLSSGGPINTLQRFLVNMFGSALVVFFLLLAFAVLQKLRTEAAPQKSHQLPQREVALSIAFCILPLFGIVGVKLTHGIFFDRYFLSSVSGWAILIGFAASGQRLRSWLPGAFAASMSFLLLADFGMALYHARKHNFILAEPSSGFLFSPDARQPMLRHASLIDPPAGEDILLFRENDYLFLVYYASPQVAAHIYDYDPVTMPFALTNKAYKILGSWTYLKFKSSALQPFLESHDRFLVYGSNGSLQPPCGDCITNIQQAGFVLKSEEKDDDGILYSYERVTPRLVGH